MFVPLPFLFLLCRLSGALLRHPFFQLFSQDKINKQSLSFLDGNPISRKLIRWGTCLCQLGCLFFFGQRFDLLTTGISLMRTDPHEGPKKLPLLCFPSKEHVSNQQDEGNLGF
jgi:hypothetical protein